MGIPLYVIFCFSLAAFNIFSLYFIFVSLINMCLSMLSLSSMELSVFPGLTISFPVLGKFSTITSSNNFSSPFSFSSSSGIPIIQMLVYLMLPQRSLRLSSILFILSSLFCSSAVISTNLSSSSLFHSSAQLFYC